MTELLYLPSIDAAYERGFRARITALPPGGVVLDRTLFYPAGGGQPCDRGTMNADGGNAFEIVDVTKSGDAVLHRLGRRGTPAGLTVGGEVSGTIDWERRHRHMRLHTLQHLLSARLFAIEGRRTNRATMAGTGGLVDLDGALAGPESLLALAADVRAHLQRGLPVKVGFVPRIDYEKWSGGRSGQAPLPAHVDPVRVVEIDAADRCPCGGTHVRSTAEVGEFEVTGPTPLPGGAVRVSFTLSEGSPPIPRA